MKRALAVVIAVTAVAATSLGLANTTATTVGPNVPAELPASVYKERRARLMAQLGGCTAVLKSFPNSSEDGGGNSFDNYFYYLTGIKESGAMLVLAPGEPIYKEEIALRPRDAEAEIWQGYRAPLSPALRDKYAVDRVTRVRGQSPRGLRQSLRHSRCLAHLRPSFAGKSDLNAGYLGKLLQSFEARTVQKWQQLETLRATHDQHEIARMQKAIAITHEGHRAAVRAMTPGTSERRVAAALEKAFVDFGATGLAFTSIVGSGINGAVLHWSSGDKLIAAGEVVVVDIGASYGGYAADITRTWPVDGTFTAEQKKVYETVLRAQEAAIAAVRPGISMEKLHTIAEKVIVDAGYELPHSLGHFVGLEVHDVGDSGGPLEAGMVVTIEPGIYLRDNFGVRIEDMVLVTPRGHRLMSGDLPRTVAEVEAYVAKARQ